MKNFRLHRPGLAMKTPQHAKCSWCEYQQDPAPGVICVNCYALMKRWLQSQRWKYVRQYLLNNADTAYCCNPFNLHPLDLIVPGKIIDHIKPWCFYPSLFWEEENHQTLCTLCHSQKTQQDGSLNFSPKGYQ